MKRVLGPLLLCACAVVSPGCSNSGTPAGQVCGTVTGTGCAPESARVDLFEPSFSDPTVVTNPLHPTSDVESMILLGTVGGESFRVEVTLLPGTKVVDWNGERIEALESQYVAFLGGRIEETALDWYAQADDGSVWYLGEDVFNYEDGVVADTDGTWLAGRDGPGAMIMPANPKVGDVYRPENIPGLVFEEVTVKSVGVVVAGPTGPVAGAIIVEELHMEGDLEDKTFAAGYGEFFTGSGGDVEAIALAVPTDALPGPAPAQLDTLLSGADDIFETAAAGNWIALDATFDAMTTAWGVYRVAGTPPMLDDQMSAALDSLDDAIVVQDPDQARHAAIHVARATLDFVLRHRPHADIDLGRFELWLRQVLVDAEADESGDVQGDVATLEWIRDRFAHTLSGSDLTALDALLVELRSEADAEDLAAAADVAEQLRTLVGGLLP